jgi:hypothetical protein
MIHRDLKIKITRKKDLEKRKLKKTNENSIHQKSKVIKSLKGSNTSQNLQMDLSITHENRISCDEVFYNFYNIFITFNFYTFIQVNIRKKERAFSIK